MLCWHGMRIFVMLTEHLAIIDFEAPAGFMYTGQRNKSISKTPTVSSSRVHVRGW